jgi:DNA gyrase subunit A
VYSTLCTLSPGDHICAVLSLPSSLEQGFLLFATSNGEVKRLKLEDLPGLSSNTFVVMDVEEDDQLGWVLLTNGTNEILLTTAQAQVIRFEETDVRPTTLPAGGMRGIKLGGQRDRVIDASVAIESGLVWCITDDGIAKASPIADYPTQGRAGSGVIAMRLPKGSMELAAASVGKADDNIIVLTDRSKPFYMRLGRAPTVPRGRQGGDILITLRAKERVASVVNYQRRVATAETPETA